MQKPVTTILTIPNMIAESDWQNLAEKSDVDYIEGDKITEENLLKIISHTDYLMIDPDAVNFELKETFYEKIVERKLPLKAISADITGMSWATPEAAKKYGIYLMNTADYSTVSVAEFTVALLLVHVKKMYTAWQFRNQGKEERPLKNDVLAGKTLGIVGLGNIGTKVAELVSGFDMTIIGWDRKEKHLPDVQQHSLEEVVRRSDFLTIHLKTTDDTKGMFNHELLTNAKEGQFIINEADGLLVNNEALLAAIRAKRISGYACANSAVNGSPLATNENVITFPPQAWFTEHSLALLRKIWVENVISAIEGKPQNLVD